MPKVGMEPIRRRQLIAATIEAIHDRGFCGVTIGEIAKRAGLSYGLAHHYFGSKEQLLAATMRQLLDSLGLELRQRLAKATTPDERIRAIIAANFGDTQFTKTLISAWLAFYLQAQTGPNARRLLQIYQIRLARNFAYAFRAYLPPEEARACAIGAAAIIDGLWLRYALAGRIPDPADAIAWAEGLIFRLIGRHEIA
ncbi:transcriptional regulator BetI [Limibacillus sp. MBR-115]|uniref:choline-binding transcriptional repressor BetI n=1 Tax=Limibacillus sp. MBR-115 TaxID=3156465 RepID=UPI0033939EAC